MESNFKGWINKAEGDLKTSGILLKADEILSDIVCFHCQQCAEKYLKAYSSYRNIFFPKTHKLKKLLALCLSVNMEFAALEITLKGLDDYSVTPRYPD